MTFQELEGFCAKLAQGSSSGGGGGDLAALGASTLPAAAPVAAGQLPGGRDSDGAVEMWLEKKVRMYYRCINATPPHPTPPRHWRQSYPPHAILRS